MLNKIKTNKKKKLRKLKNKGDTGIQISNEMKT